MIRARIWNAAYRHVAISDGLDFLNSMLMRQLVKACEEIVEQCDQGPRGHASRKHGEVNDVGEEHAHLWEGVGDSRFACLESRGDGGGQDAEQQPFIFTVKPVQRQMGVYTGQQFVRIEWFRNIVHRSEFKALDDISGFRAGGEKNYRD